MIDFAAEIARKLELPRWKVESAINLLEDGKTIPFIARYRKEQTGELNEIQLREISDNLEYLQKLEHRKEEVLKLIDERGKLTDELKEKILNAETLQLVEDLYLPYKEKRKTRADVARQKGLEPLADFLLEARRTDDSTLESFVNEEAGVSTVDDALSGARDIIAERMSQEIKIRDYLRDLFKKEGVLTSKKTDSADEKAVYSDYYEMKLHVMRLIPHRVLAMLRGEKEGILKLSVEIERYPINDILKLFDADHNLAYFNEVEKAAEDSFERLLNPSIEREIRGEVTEAAHKRAIEVFSKNLRNLLMQAPLGEKVVMGIDPGYRTGCKFAVIGKDGAVLYYDVIYPTPPKNDYRGASMKITTAVQQLNIELIAIGNGTGSRETEQFVARVIKEQKLKCKFLLVTEAGASVYSASKVAIQEFPELDVTTRGAISIARRVQDPLAEYVKIPPESIGVGMYQHDVPQSDLKKALDREVESVVNLVGVNLNTASEHLLKYISGLNTKSAKNIVEHRSGNGGFSRRDELLKINGIGPKAFEQAAGFCRIINGRNPLDSTIIHPESYDAARLIIRSADLNVDDLATDREIFSSVLKKHDWHRFAQDNSLNPITVNDIVQALCKPTLDPREELPRPLLREDILTVDQLHAGTELEGTVRNVVDFGAFVDIGVGQDGLLHKSKMGKKVRDPLEVVAVGDIIRVRIVTVEPERGRIALELLETL